MGTAARELQLKMWLFPYLTWVAIVSIVALLVGMVVLDSTRNRCCSRWRWPPSWSESGSGATASTAPPLLTSRPSPAAEAPSEEATAGVGPA